MIVGIVGPERNKFTKRGKRHVKSLIRQIVAAEGVTEVVSGKCPLGGVDIWAARIGRELGRKVTEFPPKVHNWEQGFKSRNLQIAGRANVVYCLPVDKLPEDFRGRQFKLCYHCKTDKHVKSGGCWTVHQAIKMGKKGFIVVVEN